MNLSNFKVVHEDDKSFHIAHPNGKKMVFDKGSLSEKAHKVIQGLKKESQHFDEGGEILPVDLNPNISDQAIAPTSAEAATPQDIDYSKLPVAPEVAITEAPIDRAPASVSAVNKSPEGVSIQPDQPNKQQVGLPGSTPSNEAAYQQMKEANKLGYEAAAGEGAAMSKAIANTQAQVAAKQKSSDEKIRELQAKDAQLYNEFATQKVKPSDYWEHKGTGSKLIAGIAMALGGGGAALAHQTPIAAKVIDDAINNDIEAQKANINNKHTLWNMNHEALGNERAATLATQNQLYTGLKYQLEQAGASYKSAYAKQQQMQADALINQKIGENRFKLSLMGGPTSDHQDPASLVPWLVPEHAQKEVVEEIKRAQNTKNIGDKILDDFDKSATDVRPLSGGRLKNILPGSESAYVGNLHQHLLTTIADLTGSVKQSEADALERFVPHTGNSDKEVAIKRQGLIDYINSKKQAPAAKAWGIDLQKYEGSKPLEQAPQYKTVNGVKYTRGPNGEAIKVK